MEGMVISDGADKQEKESFRYLCRETKPETGSALAI
jgi:hypothetical protein